MKGKTTSPQVGGRRETNTRQPFERCFRFKKKEEEEEEIGEATAERKSNRDSIETMCLCKIHRSTLTRRLDGQNKKSSLKGPSCVLGQLFFLS